MEAIIKLVVIGVFAAVALGAVCGVFVMLLWNGILPELFGFPEIGFLKAWGLTVLCQLLFGRTSVSNSSD